MAGEKVSALRLSMHGQLVGYVAGFDNGRNVFSLAPEYIENPDGYSLTMSMSSQEKFRVVAPKAFPRSQRMQLHPILSNLLPEGALRELLAQRMKIHQMNEFPLMVHLGADLPGRSWSSRCRRQAFRTTRLATTAGWTGLQSMLPIASHTSHWPVCR